MKKIICAFALMIMSGSVAFSRPVPVSAAQSLAVNFFNQNSANKVNSVSLVRQENSPAGDPLYYIFNVNASGGFVIVSGEGATHPILGYSTESNFESPGPKSNIEYWLRSRAQEIQAIRNASLEPDATITNEWAGMFQTNAANRLSNSNSVTSTSVTPLLHTTWNQNPNYNAMCPGGSVTGCVATAMGQIMKFWNYPTIGNGSSSYCDCTSGGFTKNYGTLSANYGTTTYSWSGMPNSISSANNAIATLMLHCGISVEMDYSPSESGAWVIAADNPICAQTSYTNYFRYDPATIQGLLRGSYTDPNWISTLQAELNIGRPLQYAGWDTTNGGHTWVCDGYDVSNNFHMNWGWGGYANGFYSINNLHPSSTSYTFSSYNEALIGIKPLPYSDFAVVPNACAGASLSITDLSANSPTAWSYTMTGGTPSVSTMQNPIVTYASPGVYSITLVSSNTTNTSVAVVKTITISSVPVLTVTTSPICAGSTAMIASSGATTYSLNTGATGSSIAVTPSITTNYTVTGSNGGCSATQTVAVNVSPVPSLTATASSSVICSGDSLTLSVAGATTYSWSSGSSSSTSIQSPTVSTVYSVVGTSGICSDSASLSVTVNLTPTVTASSNDSLICAGQTATLTGTGASTYTWSTGDTSAVMVVTPTVTTTYTLNGSSLGCNNKVIITQSVAACTGIKEIDHSATYGVYPNPSSNGNFNVTLVETGSAMLIEVYNGLGQLVASYAPKTTSQAVNISKESAGVYYLRVTQNGKLVYKSKLIKN